MHQTITAKQRPSLSSGRRFLAERARIHDERRAAAEPRDFWDYEARHLIAVGDAREQMTAEVLSAMRHNGEIIDFIKTGPGELADVRRAIDFYVIVRGVTRRKVILLQVTGLGGVSKHTKRHPLVSLVVITEWTGLEEIRDQIRMAAQEGAV